MRRIAAWLVVGFLVLGTAGCGDEEPTPSVDPSRSAGLFGTPSTGSTGSASSLADLGELTSVTFSQYQAVEGYDSTEHTTTEATQLQALRAVLEAHDWNPDWRAPGEGCDGSRSTELVLTFADGTEHAAHFEGCHDSDLVDEVNALVGTWH